MLKRERAENFTIKQMELARKQMEKRLEKLVKAERKDDVVTFEELGVDSLMIDEAHMFKNLMCVSKMRNVAGISQTESQRASDLLMKTMYLDEITGGRGVTFATGTPLSNSMTELYTMQRYLQRHTLEINGLSNFDAWASTFGETVTAIELAPEGTGYRTKTRFAKFYNLPELMAMFKECADIQTADMLKLPVPDLEGGKPINVQLQPSSIQRVMVADLGKRADTVRKGSVDPKEDIQVTRLRTLKAQYTSQHYRMEDAVTIVFPAEIQKAKGRIANCTADAKTVEEHTHLDDEGKDTFSICLMDTTYDKREDAGRALLGLIGAAMTSEKPVPIGSYKGLTVQAIYFPLAQEFHAQLVGAGVYDVQLGADAAGNITRIANAAAGITKLRETAANDLVQLEKQLENARDELQQPFKQEQELAEKSRRLAELNALLNMNDKDRVVDTVPDEESQVSMRPARQRCEIER